MTTVSSVSGRGFPDWVPEEVRRYIAHVEGGRSIRSLARDAGLHASTILRQVRRFETRRDDLLVDRAIRRLGAAAVKAEATDRNKDGTTMTLAEMTHTIVPPDDEALRREAPRILRRLNESGACLAIAADMEKGVVVREMPDGRALRTAVLERGLAEALVLKDWIASSGEGRIVRYRITQSGRMALKRFLAEEETARAGMSEAAQPFADQHREIETREFGAKPRRKRVRYNAAESPVVALSRRKDKDGTPFLGHDLVAAAERLREDFELAHIGPRVTQNWERFLTAGTTSAVPAERGASGSDSARARVQAALSDLGPGLGDVVLRCCCYLEGMEAVESRMGWSARSGKIVLRIGLMRLKRHYDERHGSWSPLIG